MEVLRRNQLGGKMNFIKRAVREKQWNSKKETCNGRTVLNVYEIINCEVSFSPTQ